MHSGQALILLLPHVTNHAVIGAAARLVAAGSVVLHSAAGETIADSLSRQFATLAVHAQPLTLVLMTPCMSDAQKAAPRQVAVAPVTVHVVGDCRTAHALINAALQCTAETRTAADRSSPTSQSPSVWRTTLRSSTSAVCSDRGTKRGEAPVDGTKLLVDIRIIRDMQLFAVADQWKHSALPRSLSGAACTVGTDEAGPSRGDWVFSTASGDAALSASP